MVKFQTLRKHALSFPETSEAPHFEKISFRVKGKIFATFDVAQNKACLKLSEIHQDVFAMTDRSSIYPVNNKWGKQGWTWVELEKVDEEIFIDALTTAYCEVAPKKLAEQIRPNGVE
jgi:predicted DNA-binding protein (MmcQ/YjbR family)